MWTRPRTGSCSTEILRANAESPRPKGRTVFTADGSEAGGGGIRVSGSGASFLCALARQGMQIAISDEDIDEFIGIINQIAQEHPILGGQNISWARRSR